MQWVKRNYVNRIGLPYTFFWSNSSTYRSFQHNTSISADSSQGLKCIDGFKIFSLKMSKEIPILPFYPVLDLSLDNVVGWTYSLHLSSPWFHLIIEAQGNCQTSQSVHSVILVAPCETSQNSFSWMPPSCWCSVGCQIPPAGNSPTRYLALRKIRYCVNIAGTEDSLVGRRVNNLWQVGEP